MSWFAEQAPPKDPPTEPRATQSHAAPAGGPSVAHQESSGHEEAPAGARCTVPASGGGALGLQRPHQAAAAAGAHTAGPAGARHRRMRRRPHGVAGTSPPHKRWARGAPGTCSGA